MMLVGVAVLVAGLAGEARAECPDSVPGELCDCTGTLGCIPPDVRPAGGMVWLRYVPGARYTLRSLGGAETELVGRFDAGLARVEIPATTTRSGHVLRDGVRVMAVIIAEPMPAIREPGWLPPEAWSTPRGEEAWLLARVLELSPVPGHASRVRLDISRIGNVLHDRGRIAVRLYDRAAPTQAAFASFANPLVCSKEPMPPPPTSLEIDLMPGSEACYEVTGWDHAGAPTSDILCQRIATPADARFAGPLREHAGTSWMLPLLLLAPAVLGLALTSRITRA